MTKVLIACKAKFKKKLFEIRIETSWLKSTWNRQGIVKINYNKRCFTTKGERSCPGKEL